MHFTRSRKKFNLSASIRIEDNELHPETEVKILGLLLDSKLSWSAHARYAVDRARRQSAVFDRLVKSTWGPIFLSSRRLYTAIVRPSIAYAAPIWFPKAKPSTLVTKLEKIQSKCLRAISGAYKAAPIHLLHSETFVPPLDLHLQRRTNSFQNRLANSDVLQHRDLLCSWIRRRTKQRTPRGTQSPSSQIGSESDLHDHWVRRWEVKQFGRASSRWDAVVCPPDKRVLTLHKHLRKAESSALVQFRTGRNGLR
ncbi:hypothetical protein K3495_g14823, partial [Podosphaera aphanis]